MQEKSQSLTITVAKSALVSSNREEKIIELINTISDSKVTSFTIEEGDKNTLSRFSFLVIDMKSSFEQNGGTYRTVGDYRIPNITLPAEARKPLGVWGLKRKDYLMQHK